MNTPEKRRTGVGSGHILRAGGSRHGSGSSAGVGAGTSSVGGGGTNNSNSNSNSGSGMPAPPPKVAMPNPGGSPDEPHDGGVSLADRKDKDKDGQKDGQSTTANPSSGTTQGSRPGSVKSSKGKHKDRDSAAASALAREREKDEQIAHLKKEMETMERAFQQQLDKMSQNESEMATFWQNKHSHLNQTYLRVDTELRLLRTEVEVREAEREELRRGFDVLRREVREREEEARGLRAQVKGLKEFVSTSTRTDGQTSDEVFGDGMARLGNGLQNWVMVHFRRAKLALGDADEATLAEVGELVPVYEELSQRSAKVHLLQSLVSRVLVEMVFDAYYVGLSEEQMTQFRQMEKLLLSFCASDEAVNQWRSSTLALLRREAPTRLRDETSTFTQAVVSRITRLLDAITTSTTPPETSSSAARPDVDTRDSALGALVTTALDLARLLAVQKAVLRVHMPPVLPHQSIPFERDSMEDVGGEDEDALEMGRRDIACVVFPGLIKQGDENGGHLQYRNVIAKARVLCNPEDEDG